MCREFGHPLLLYSRIPQKRAEAKQARETRIPMLSGSRVADAAIFVVATSSLAAAVVVRRGWCSVLNSPRCAAISS